MCLHHYDHDIKYPQKVVVALGLGAISGYELESASNLISSSSWRRKNFPSVSGYLWGFFADKISNPNASMFC